MADKRDYYKTLNVAKDASTDEIKKAYRKLALKYHPDKVGGDEARFKEIGEAYAVLSDPTKRQAYDQFGHAGVGAGATSTGGPFGGGRTYSVNFEDFNFGGFGGGIDDIFEMFFRGTRQRPRDVEINLTIDFKEAVFGATKELNLRLADREKGERKTETVTVKIPAGIDDGQSIRLSGHGEIGPNNQRGDLFVHVRVRPDKRFKREGPHILSEVTIDMVDAALGATASVETLDGKVTIKIPSGTQSGKIIKLSGRGVPIVGTSKRGDYLVSVQVETPTKLTPQQKRLLGEFKDSKSHRTFW